MISVLFCLYARKGVKLIFYPFFLSKIFLFNYFVLYLLTKRIQILIKTEHYEDYRRTKNINSELFRFLLF